VDGLFGLGSSEQNRQVEQLAGAQKKYDNKVGTAIEHEHNKTSEHQLCV